MYFNYKYQHAQIILQNIFYTVIPFKYQNSIGVKFFQQENEKNLYIPRNMKRAAKILSDLIYQACSNHKEIICIPLNLYVDSSSGHANLLIFRPKLWTLEWYEPHGDQLYCSRGQPLIKKILLFCHILRTQLQNDFNEYIDFYPPEQTCPMKRGPQRYDEITGRCALWAILTTQLAITNPNVSAQTFMKKFQQNEKKEDLFNRHTNIGNGFIKHFNHIFIRYYNIDIASVFEQNQKDPKYLRFQNEMLQKLIHINTMPVISRPQQLFLLNYVGKEAPGDKEIDASSFSEINYLSNDLSSLSSKK